MTLVFADQVNARNKNRRTKKGKMIEATNEKQDQATASSCLNVFTALAITRAVLVEGSWGFSPPQLVSVNPQWFDISYQRLGSMCSPITACMVSTSQASFQYYEPSRECTKYVFSYTVLSKTSAMQNRGILAHFQ